MPDGKLCPTTQTLKDTIEHRYTANTDRFIPDVLQLVAIDPGGMTGWSAISLPTHINGKEIFKCKIEEIFSHRFRWVHGQVPCYTLHHGSDILCRNLIDQWTQAPVIIEDFYIRTKAVDLAPEHVTAILKHHMYLRNRHWQIHRQQPAMAKRITDDRLMRLGLYQSTGGLNHARDADRHLVMTLRRCFENKGLKERLWPHVFERSN